MSLRKKDPQNIDTMSSALGILDSGLLLQGEQTQVIAPNEPLDKLLLNRRFRQSFMEFADRYQLYALEIIWSRIFAFICFFCHVVAWLGKVFIFMMKYNNLTTFL